MDARSDLCIVSVNQGYDAAATSITLVPTDTNLVRVKDPAVDGQYNLVWWDDTVYRGNPSRDPNAEIVRITSKTGNVLTVIRGQGVTTATTKNTSGSTYSMMSAPFAKYFDDLDADSVDIGEETKYVTELTSTGAPGAAGDGVTVDTTAIQDHVTNGNLVVFPPGTYIIGGTITIGHSNITLKGAGIGVTTIKFANSVGASSMFKSTSFSNITVQDMTLDGNKANNASALDGFELITCTDVFFQNVEFKNCKRHGANIGGSSCVIQNCKFTSQESSGVSITGDNNVVRDSRITSNGTGVTIASGSDDCIISGCYFVSNSTALTNSGTGLRCLANLGIPDRLWSGSDIELIGATSGVDKGSRLIIRNLSTNVTTNSGLSTQTVTDFFPSTGFVILAMCGRVTTTVNGTVETLSVGDSGNPSKFEQNMALASGSTFDLSDAAAGAAMIYQAGSGTTNDLRITRSAGTFSTGAIRIDAWVLTAIPPTS